MKFKKGVLTTDKGVPVDNLGTAMDTQAVEQCCGFDCCEGIFRIPQKPDGEPYAGYVKGGVFLIVPLADYFIDKAAGFPD